jgi:hypothetical protein
MPGWPNYVAFATLLAGTIRVGPEALGRISKFMGIPAGTRHDDRGMREMIQAARMIVMQMGQDDGVDIPPRVNLHIVQTCADLFVRRYFDMDFLCENGFQRGR